jgi:uncharacterized protein (TIGR03083 family)
MSDYVDAIATDSERVAELAGQDRLGVAVPSCPGWTLADLIAHLGEVQRFWAANVRTANPAAAWPEEAPPMDGDDPAGWMRQSTAELLGALRAAADTDPCWTWWGNPATAGAVARHQVQEAAVHRWDAENAAGAPTPLTAAVAHDGVAEFLTIVLGNRAELLPGTVLLRSTDTAGEWSAGFNPDRTAIVEATASDLVLALYRRVTWSGLTVSGDAELAAELFGTADTE